MRYRAKRGLAIPMPDRGNASMPDGGEGVSVDETSTYYARLLADGDIVAVEEKADTPPPPPPPANPKDTK